MKKALSITLDEKVVELVEILAKEENRTLSSMINAILVEKLVRKPKIVN